MKLIHCGELEIEVGDAIESEYALLWLKLVQTQFKTVFPFNKHAEEHEKSKKIFLVPCEIAAQEQSALDYSIFDRENNSADLYIFEQFDNEQNYTCNWHN